LLSAGRVFSSPVPHPFFFFFFGEPPLSRVGIFFSPLPGFLPHRPTMLRSLRSGSPRRTLWALNVQRPGFFFFRFLWAFFFFPLRRPLFLPTGTDTVPAEVCTHPTRSAALWRACFLIFGSCHFKVVILPSWAWRGHSLLWYPPPPGQRLEARVFSKPPPKKKQKTPRLLLPSSRRLRLPCSGVAILLGADSFFPTAHPRLFFFYPSGMVPNSLSSDLEGAPLGPYGLTYKTRTFWFFFFPYLAAGSYRYSFILVSPADVSPPRGSPPKACVVKFVFSLFLF